MLAKGHKADVLMTNGMGCGNVDHIEEVVDDAGQKGVLDTRQKDDRVGSGGGFSGKGRKKITRKRRGFTMMAKRRQAAE